MRTVRARSFVLRLAVGLLIAGCASRDSIEPESAADVQPVGDPVRRSLSVGEYIVELSFGGNEFVIHDPSRNYDPEYLQFLKETERNVQYAIYRYADYLWEGLVKNHGDLAADSVYVRIRFADGIIDSAYVDDRRVNPNETVPYSLYSLGDRVDEIDILWYGMPED